MLRSIESKLGGLILVLVFLFLLWLPTFTDSCVYSLTRQFAFWSGVSLYFLLSFLGACHPEAPFVFIRKASSILLVFVLFWFKGLLSLPYPFLGTSPLRLLGNVFVF